MNKQQALDTIEEIKDFIAVEIPRLSNFDKDRAVQLASNFDAVSQAVADGRCDTMEIKKILAGVSANLSEIFGYSTDSPIAAEYSRLYKEIRPYLDAEVFPHSLT